MFFLKCPVQYVSILLHVYAPYLYFDIEDEPKLTCKERIEYNWILLKCELLILVNDFVPIYYIGRTLYYQEYYILPFSDVLSNI